MILFFRRFCVAFAVFSPVFFANGQFLEIIFQTRTPLPNHPGLEISSISSGTTHLGLNGHFIGEARLSGESVTSENDEAVIYVTPDRELTILLREGDAVSGIIPAGSSFLNVSRVFVDQDGQVAFSAAIQTPEDSHVVTHFRGVPPVVEAYAHTGLLIGEQSLKVSNLRLLDNGTFAFSGTLGLVRETIWRDEAADGEIQVTEDVLYPGMPPEEGRFTGVGPVFELRDNGDILFNAQYRWKPEPFREVSEAGLWIKADDEVMPIIFNDDSAPGLPDLAVELSLSQLDRNFVISDNGWVAFRGKVKGSGVTTVNDECLFASDFQTDHLVVREGDSAPGTTGTFGDAFFLDAISPEGVVLFHNRVDQPGGGSEQSVWTWKAGQLKLIAMGGQEAPGIPEVTYDRVTQPTISRDGRVAFESLLSNRDSTIWLTDPNGDEPQLVIAEGEFIPLAGGGSEAIRDAGLLGNGHGYQFDSDGRLLANLILNSGSTVYALLDPDVSRAGISGTVFQDNDGSGGFSAEDTGYPQVAVDLFADDGQGNPTGASLLQASTDTHGNYLFSNLDSGNYVVRLTVPDGFNFVADSAEPTQDLLVPLAYAAGENSPGHDFLIALKPVSIAGIVFGDEDNDGDFSEPDTGVFNIQVELYADDGQGKPMGPVLQDAVTGPFGDYQFKELTTGNYVVVVVVPENFDFIRDLTNPIDDQSIPVVYQEGERVDGRDFLISKQVDVALKVSMHSLNFEGSSNLEGGLADIDLPLEPVEDPEVLRRQPEVSQGLVADGVTPLLFKIETFGGEFPGTRKIAASLENISGGEFLVGPAMVALGANWSVPAANFVFPSATTAWCMLLPNLADELKFDDGFNELSATFRITDLVSGKVLVEQGFGIRKPPVTLIHGYNTRGDWGDAYREQLGLSRPVSEDLDNFVITIRYGQTSVEDLGRVLSPLIGGELLDQGRENTVYSLFYLGRILQKELDEALGPLHDRWAFNRHDVVAHSQGGLLTRILCSEDPVSVFDNGLFPPEPVRPFQSIENLNRGRFHRIVTIGSPHNGSLLVRYLTALLQGNPKLSRLESIPNVIAALGVLSGTARDKFDPLGNQIKELNDPNGRWKPDPQAKFHLVRTRINQGMPPSAASATFGNSILGLAGPGGAVVLPFGSDAVVDFQSMGGQAPGDAKANNVFDLATSAEISHSGPVALFSRDRKNPDATGQTNSLVAATHIREALDNDPGRPAGERVFGPFPLPRLLTGPELQPIADFAFSREVSLEALVNLAEGQPQNSESGMPAMQAEEDNTFPVGSSLNVALEIAVPEAHPLSGAVSWLVEYFGPNGPEFLYDQVTVNETDSRRASFQMSGASLGDYYIHAFYYSTDGVQVFSKPFLAASVAPDPSEIQAFEFVLPSMEVVSGEWIQPWLQVLYQNGSRVLKPLYGLELSQSDQEVLDIANPGLWRGLIAGSSEATVSFGGRTASTTVAVIQPAQKGALTYRDWLDAYFTEEELEDVLISGPSASTDLDPLGNALEFLFAQDPRQADGAAVLAAESVEVDGQRYPAVRMKLRSDLGDLSATIQQSSDLDAWEDFFSINDALESGFTSPQILDGQYSPEANQFTIRGDQPLENIEDERFFRLWVDVPVE